MLVRESIDFVRGKDSKKALNLGIEAHIDQWMKDAGLNSRYELREYSDGRRTIWYYGVLDLKLDKTGFPDFINFEYAHQLQIQGSKMKTFPEGIPEEIGGQSMGNVIANANPQLESFINFPKKIRKNLYAINNPKLTSLEGFPLVIAGDVYLNGSGLDKITWPEETMTERRREMSSKIKEICQLVGEINW